MSFNYSQRRLKDGVDIFSGIIRCGFCGRSYGFDSNIGYYVNRVCRDGGCKYSINIKDNVVNRILLEFQNELLSNYNQIFKYNKKDNNRMIRKVKTSYNNERLYYLEQILNDKVNKYEFNNLIDDTNYRYGNKQNEIETDEIKSESINKILTTLKNRLLSIDSFPAYEPSKELVDILVKYIQFGETLKHNYKNKLNCRIVLKVNDYNASKFSAKKDLTEICKNENYIELWKFHSTFNYRKRNNYIKVKIVIDKKDIEV